MKNFVRIKRRTGDSYRSGTTTVTMLFCRAERRGLCFGFSGGRDEWGSNGDTMTYPEEYIKPYKECEETE